MSMPHFSYVWEYEVSPQAEAEFLAHYAPEGSWARLFRRASGYSRTQLFRDRRRPDRYLTVDHWRDEASFLEFRRAFAAEFETLDRACAALTRREVHLGDFEPICGDLSP